MKSFHLYCFFIFLLSFNLAEASSEQEKDITSTRELLNWTFKHDCSDLKDGKTAWVVAEELKKAVVLEDCSICSHLDLTLQEVFKIEEIAFFGANKNKKDCFHPAYQTLFNGLAFEQKRASFHHHLQQLQSHQEQIIYDHQYFSFKLSEAAGSELEYIMEYVERFHSHPDFFDQQDRMLLSSDTNTDSDQSRKEIIDLLTWQLGRSKLYEFGESAIYRNNLARNLLMNALLPATSNTTDDQIFILPATKSSIEEIGQPYTFISCGSNKIKAKFNNSIYSEQNYVKSKGPLVYGLQLTQSDVFSFQREKTQVELQCGNKKYQLTFPLNPLSSILNLSSLSNFSFSFSPENKFEAFITMGLIDEMSPMIAQAMVFFLGTKGYSLVEQNEITTVKATFLELLGTADLYMPISHSMTLSEFDIGQEQSTLYSFIKTLDQGRQLKLNILTPSIINRENNHTMVATAQEVSQALIRRLDNQNNLLVLNISCEASRAIPQWMSAYFNSLRISNKQISAPLVIASNRYFETSSNAALMQHLEYPLGMLELAENEAPIQTILGFLNADPNTKPRASKSFEPISNVGKDYDRNSNSNQQIALTLIDEDGHQYNY